MKITTIKLTEATKKRLDKLKIHKRETYDDVIQKMLGILNTVKADPYQARSKLAHIDQLRQGK